MGLTEQTWHKDKATIAKDLTPYVAPEVKSAPFQEGFLVIIDPISTGAMVAHFAVNKNKYPVVRVNSNELSETLKGFIPKGLSLTYSATFDEQDTLAATVAQLRAVETKLGLKCVGVIPGSEPGVTLADKLSEAIGVTTNGTKLSACRRNKYDMGERVRAAGLRAAVQKRITKFEDVDAFITELKEVERKAKGRVLDKDDYFTAMMTTKDEEFKAILKPLDSAGSDGVYLCHSRAELKAAYDKVVGATNLFNSVNTECLVQEFLGGTEYVVDTVSSHGVHKVAAVWAYEKKKANDAPFVYFAMRLMDCAEPRMQSIIKYQFQVLDALGIENGPSHAEVKYYRGEPVLIEVGNRPHGLEGMFVPVADACLGYNQAELAVDAYLHPEKFDSLPAVPKMLNAGGMVTLVNFKAGVVKGFSNRKRIQSLPSFFSLDVFVEKNTTCPLTVDVMTIPGVCCLINSSRAVVEKDIASIRALEEDGLFDVV